MPDASGRFKGISVPRIPWDNERKHDETDGVRCGCFLNSYVIDDLCACADELDAANDAEHAGRTTSS